ncbi:Phospho-N-acetylmuramoyl-pentapeptide- transferase [Rickettsia prowazekii str. Breinl]|nr:Phospho-N-acetylmuramoyl-pentapeptide- transferase [Rickettsia prowazekii str. NMRC Madrid E]AGJ02246.1 Phospho-N-acetylmuramoyl-pentapeptide- transferase [Rickettsia prowazekii str. Breinl]EOB09970.1 hypothetical protein H376_9150 [Rickettsia prowazekii str. GvF12]EOB10874.1 hypothetical protein H377_1750 [Rickettsia prowazekii str. Cairo 3]
MMINILICYDSFFYKPIVHLASVLDLTSYINLLYYSILINIKYSKISNYCGHYFLPFNNLVLTSFALCQITITNFLVLATAYILPFILLTIWQLPVMVLRWLSLKRLPFCSTCIASKIVKSTYKTLNIQNCY